MSDSVCITCKREKDKSPFTYAETVGYVRDKLIEGIARGESLVSLLEVCIVDALFLEDGEKIMAYIRKRNQEQIDFYKSPSHKVFVCTKCRAVRELEKALCTNCHEGRDLWGELKA